MAHFGKGGGDRRFGGESRGGNSGFGAREYGRPHDSGGFAKKGWDDRSGGDRRERGDITMHTATCSNCHKNCEVPFKPNGSKPVYCKDCFGAMKGNGSPDGDRRDRKDFGGDREARPTRPAFESTKGNDESKKHFETLTVKIDALTRSVDMLVKALHAPHTHEHASEVTAPVAKSVAPAKKAAAKIAVTKVVKVAEKKPAKKAATPKKKK